MPAMAPAPVYGTYEYAGEIAKAWFGRLDRAFKTMTTLECRQYEDYILDVALSDAGVTPLDSEIPSPDFFAALKA